MSEINKNPEIVEKVEEPTEENPFKNQVTFEVNTDEKTITVLYYAIWTMCRDDYVAAFKSDYKFGEDVDMKEKSLKVEMGGLPHRNWQKGFSLTIPDDCKSGVYGIKLSCAPSTPEKADLAEFLITLFVSPARGAAAAPVAFLMSNITHLAYANTHHTWHESLAEQCFGALVELSPGDQLLHKRAELGLSAYDVHSDGSGCFYSTHLRPLLNMQPDYFWADPGIFAWLDKTGQDYDLITDDDLHAGGTELLGRYRCVMTGSHPEYFTAPMMHAVDEYLQQGGRLMYLGGNGFYWHTAVSPDYPGAIEIRRAGGGTRTWASEPGEHYLGFTGRLGGLWAESGIAPQRLTGVGYSAMGFDKSSYYLRREGSFDPRVAFIFEGVGADEKIGDFGYRGGGAAGDELDTIDFAQGTPPHTLHLAASTGHSHLTLLTPERLMSTLPTLDGTNNADVRADMVFFETPNGGGVFSTGSITWGASLTVNECDNNVARITGNVLKRFIDPAPL